MWVEEFLAQRQVYTASPWLSNMAFEVFISMDLSTL